MQVGYRARVVELVRDTENDRTSFVSQTGLIVRRLNVAWEPTLGALWQLRFEDGTEEIFAESEIQQLGRDGKLEPKVTDGLSETWGVAPRTRSFPFTRFGQGQASAPRILALLLLVLAGVLLAVAGATTQSTPLLLGGLALTAFGILAAMVITS